MNLDNIIEPIFINVISIIHDGRRSFPLFVTGPRIEMGANICMNSWSSWYITHYPRQRLKVCQFSFIHAGPSLEYCVASMYVTPLLCYLCNSISTSHMHPQIYWEGCQCLHWWLEFMVHHTPSHARARSVPVFIHPPMGHFVVLCGQYGCDSLDWLVVQ